jgi:hypothetical protein
MAVTPRSLAVTGELEEPEQTHHPEHTGAAEIQARAEVEG